METQVQFETAPDLVSGIELSANGQKVAWSIADYLATLEKVPLANFCDRGAVHEREAASGGKRRSRKRRKTRSRKRRKNAKPQAAAKGGTIEQLV